MKRHRPVFVDSSGRRRRAVVVLGSGLGVLLVAGIVTITAGLLTGSPVPLPGWPDAAHADQIAPTPAPIRSPSVTKSLPSKPATATTAPAATSTAASTGNGNGNGHGRPTKTPGKPG